jgi:hypothetical protein
MQVARFRLAKVLAFSLILIAEAGACSNGYGSSLEGATFKSHPLLASHVDEDWITVASEDDSLPVCPTFGPQGPWGYYQSRDLPRGQCSGAPDCKLWARDSCPGTDSPGPAVKWKCVCNSGTWRCDELERTKAVCLGR